MVYKVKKRNSKLSDRIKKQLVGFFQENGLKIWIGTIVGIQGSVIAYVLNTCTLPGQPDYWLNILCITFGVIFVAIFSNIKESTWIILWYSIFSIIIFFGLTYKVTSLHKYISDQKIGSK